MTVRRWMLVVGVLTMLGSLVVLDARATRGAQVTADEPQYLLSALSVAEDADLDISDELLDERFRPFHEIELNQQTEPTADGRELSPHDPLLPVLLAPAMSVAGWELAKATLALIAGVLAALLVWVAARRLRVPPALPALVVSACTLTAPLTTYGAQVYPELPAALAVTVAVAALTGPLRRGGIVVLLLSVIVLPWLGVKYAPVGAAIVVCAVVVLVRDGRRRAAAATVCSLAAAAVAFFVVHRVVYGGWTVYAAGDHFVDSELDVVGSSPNYLGRGQRLSGLLLDRDFGLAAWSPVYLLGVPALGWVLARRPTRWGVLALPLTAGWLTATFVAFTMHGWWWPGRQLVVVLPCVVLMLACWAATTRARLAAVCCAGMVGVWLWATYLGSVLAGSRLLIIDVSDTVDPIASVWRAVLPDFRSGPAALTHTLWLAAMAAAFLAAYRRARHEPPGEEPAPIPTDTTSSPRPPVATTV